MSDEARDITDEMLLSELTVGEFRALMQELLSNLTVRSDDAVSNFDAPIATEQPKVIMERKSLDDFMKDLSGD